MILNTLFRGFTLALIVHTFRFHSLIHEAMQKGVILSFGVFLIVCVTRVKLTHTSQDEYHQIINPKEIKAIDMNEPWPFSHTLSQVDPSLDDLMVLAKQNREKVI